MLGRRDLSAGLALLLGGISVVPTAAHAYVEGLPLYAPSSGSLGGGVGSGFPDKGFETLLPQAVMCPPAASHTLLLVRHMPLLEQRLRWRH